MNKKTVPVDYIEANSELFRLDFVCKIVDVTGDISSGIAKANKENITYIQVIKDFCIYLECIAYNAFEDININIILGFNENNSIRKSSLKLYEELYFKSEAIHISGDCYTLVDNEIIFYDPDLKNLGFIY